MARTGWKYWLLGPEKQPKLEDRAVELGFQQGSEPPLPEDVEVEKIVDCWHNPSTDEWYAAVEHPVDHRGFRRQLGGRQSTYFGRPASADREFLLWREEVVQAWLDWSILAEGRLAEAAPGVVAIASAPGTADGEADLAARLRAFILGASPTSGARVHGGFAWGISGGRPNNAAGFDRFRELAEATAAIAMGTEPSVEPHKEIVVDSSSPVDPFEGVDGSLLDWVRSRGLQPHSFGWLPTADHASVSRSSWAYIQGAGFGHLEGDIPAALAHYRSVLHTPGASGSDTAEGRYTLACAQLPAASGWIGRLIAAKQRGGKRIDAIQDLLRKDHRVHLESVDLDQRIDVFVEDPSDGNRARQLFSPAFITGLLERLPDKVGFELYDGVLSAQRPGDLTDHADLDALWDLTGWLAQRITDEAAE